ncbi:DUF4214 domain-containing protein [Pseudosulfitobacter sp. DSM 107133]|uniref:DUF4214 domain-containing protein n=1 Tax=Pseudosulfitobacter sp. DSM 107133 TaxID=2883100 RepID=UPI000DF2C2D1|nr:DUF4214 domain-containing protein [Pseudosulfitobacter sp. DSM 107133]
MTRPNLFISSLINSENSDVSSLFNTAAIDAFELDFQAQIDALGSDGSLTSAALDGDPTSIKANEIIWGNTTNGAVLTGSGLDQINNMDQLDQALENGVASGAFDTMRIYAGGQNVLSLNFATSALTLSSGNQSVALLGVLPTSLQDIFDFLTQLDNVADGVDLDTAVQILRQFDLGGLRIVDNGTTLFDLAFDNDGLRISAAGGQFRIDGSFPADSLGDIIDLVRDLDELDKTAAGFVSLSQQPDLEINSISLTAADGTKLIRTSGALDEVDPLFNNLIIEGTSGDDRDVFSDGDFADANQIVMQLGAGNDSALFFGGQFGLESGDTPVRVNGGAGFDTVRVYDFGSQQVVADFNNQSLSGRQLEDHFNYRIDLEAVEAVEINTAQRAVVLGDNAANTAIAGDVFGRFEFFGGGGTDTLDLTKVVRMSTNVPGLSQSDLAGFSAIYGGNNSIEMSHGDLHVTFVLGDVEQVRVKAAGGGTTTVSLTELLQSTSSLARFMVGTSEDDSLSGDFGADVILGQSGSDYLYGDGIQANLTGDIAGQVYRMYQATLDRAPDAVGYEGWVTNLYEGTQTLTNLPNGFVNSGEFKNTYGALDDSGFVNLLYQNVLGRDADAGGLQGWLDAMAAGTTRAGVVLGFSESKEFKLSTAQAAAEFALSQSESHWTDEIYRVYRATLDRDPDAGGFAGWAEMLGSGTTYGTMVNGFVNSREFKNTYGALDDAGFVELLYQNVLDRAADAGGLQGWLDFLSGGGTRAGVVEGFAQSGEFKLGTAADLTAWVKAQGTHDTIIVDGGTNVVMGGILSDHFEFRAGGNTTIVDFEDWDELGMRNFGYDSFETFQSHLTQSGNDVVFADQGTTFTLIGTQLGDVTAAHVDLF